MKAAIFSAHDYDRKYLSAANMQAQHELVFISECLNQHTVEMARGFEIVSCFVVDDLGKAVLEQLAAGGTRLIALRSVGYDHVDLVTAAQLGITVVRVPTYSPSAVAEFAVLLLLALARQLPRSERQFNQNNFVLDNLLGQGIKGKIVGIIGTGNIGMAFAQIMRGFGCTVVAYDPYPNQEAASVGIQYLSLDEVFSRSDFISIHCPLNEKTRHLINSESLKLMNSRSYLINTARGPVVDSQAVLNALDTEKLAGYAMDVYEREQGLFFIDHGNEQIKDPLFLSLRDHPKVLVSAHQAFFTEEAITNIARTTIDNITRYSHGEVKNQVTS